MSGGRSPDVVTVTPGDAGRPTGQGAGSAPEDGEAPGSGRGAVRLERLTKRYPGTTAVDDLSLTVAAGEFVALLGPSGCGKSTTLRMLAGLEQPDAGVVRVSGVDVTRTPAHRRDIHTVFQSYALFPHLDVADNIAFPLRQRGLARSQVAARVQEALDVVRLPHAAKLSVTSLSGGQQQRVALARAVVDRPSVLLLDEPLSALDRALRQAMQVELRLLQQELGITTVLVTHDQEEALSLADRIVVMSEGRIVQQGTAEQIYDHPATLFAARFVGENNELPGHSDGTGTLTHPAVTAISASPTVAGPALALVRPEHVRVTELPAAAPHHPRPEPGAADHVPDAVPGVNTVSGVVRGASVAGMSSLVLVQVDHDTTVLARVPRDGRRLPSAGQSVQCSWQAQHVRIFPLQDGAHRP
ncbi:ABC transporter ATP-binding protein [Kineosporia sp. A_224]|uniref:ABC transporter ATP-binding protein n=1 Tax=Kineosporia sp. A_224 TaxID=1962180 RepID=UPI000B4AF752|nr:ABC transporter ATP-binding protein [Kineosporia sp. A_224]